MGEIIYDNVIINTESEGTNIERMEMMVDIYECADSVRDHDFKTEINTHQQHQRIVTVFLVLLCVLLLTSVIVLCVLINTNNQQFNIKTKNLTVEKDQLLTKYTNITEERDQLLTKYTNITEERDQLLTKYTNITKERDQLLTKKHNLTEERHKLIAKYNNVTKLNEQLEEENKLWTQLNDGWIYYQSSLYFISSEKKSWSDSRRYCRERGADLIVINNRQEQDFIKKYSVNDKLWIGLTDSDKEGRWKWVDGTTQSYKFWASREPNGGRGENCVLSSSSGWADFPYTHAFKWICERAL